MVRWVWLTCFGASTFVCAQTVTFTSTPTALAPTSITVGPDNNLWFTEGNFLLGQTSLTVGKLTTGGSLTEFPNLGATGGVCVASIAKGPDNNLWVAVGNAIGSGTFGPVLRINTSGSVTGSPTNPGPATPGNFETPQSGSCVLSMVSGPGGVLWATEAVIAGDKVATINTSGVFTNQFSIPEGGGAADPSIITTGSDGNLWFTENTAFRIGMVTPGGVFNDRLLPGITFNGTSFVGPTMDNPLGIISGPDGALWFTEEGGSGVGAAPSKIGRITTGGSISEFPTPTSSSFPLSITVGPDGALWFTEAGANKLGRITTGGTITEFPISSGSGTSPGAITLGPDGALYFTQSTTGGGGFIGRVVITNSAPAPTPVPSTLLLMMAGIVATGVFAAIRRSARPEQRL